VHREYKVTEIPGVIAAGQQWKTVWTGRGNNADGILADGDALLAAQNTDSKVMRIDKNGKVSFPYSGTNTGGALSMNKKGALFVIERGLPTGILQLKPKRQVLANMYNGEPFECTGSGTNDLTADSKGGVYFTMGGLYYANPKGVVTKYGRLERVNGLVLSADEKILYVTGTLTPAPAPAAPAAPAPGAVPPVPGAAPAAGGGGGARGGPPAPSAHVGVVAFDVQPDGSLTNERQFATVGNDGTTIDSQGRVYTTGGVGVAVLSPDGKLLGEIPAPLNLITAAFAGPDKKTLYGVANNQQYVEIYAIQMIAQGYKGRAK
jgi:gluconolactonase